MALLAHMSTSGGLSTAFDRGLAVGLNTMQIFTNQIAGSEAHSARNVARPRSKPRPVSHPWYRAAYLLNLGAHDGWRSRSILADDWRAEELGLRLVFHPEHEAGEERQRAEMTGPR
jgi:endonuclease IV